MKVKVINRSAYGLPQYETGQAAGLDVRANITESITLGPLERALVPTGLYVELPEGYEMQVRPRSGLAAKHGLSLVNSPGTVDPDYRGEIKVILVNLSNTPYELKPGERVAQPALRGSNGRVSRCSARRSAARADSVRPGQNNRTLPDRRSSLLFVDSSGDVFVFYENIEFLLQ